MNSEWKRYKLNDICKNIYSGGTPNTSCNAYWNGNINWLSSGETNQRFIFDTVKKITQKGVEESSTKLAKKCCTVIASAGQGHTRGQVSYLMVDTFVNQSVIVFEPDFNLVDPLYLYYNLDNRYDEFRLLSDGTSTRGGLSGRIVKSMDIWIPSINIQKKITSILYNIDAIIELNKRINHNLVA